MWRVVVGLSFVVFKRETAYEMRISGWSSDVCSSDLNNFVYPRLLFGCFFYVVDKLFPGFRNGRGLLPARNSHLPRHGGVPLHQRDIPNSYSRRLSGNCYLNLPGV